ncbi:MAG TPA: oligosaccharide flippase family protein [Steroidobacteraceae bacterium]|nr:oligosaccharide flippase family protein [Steroidobacteraceae bacterium]
MRSPLPALDSLTWDSLATLFLRSSLVGLEFLCAIVVARRFGATAYGVLALVTSSIVLLAIPATLGFDRLLLRESALLKASGKFGELRVLLVTATKIVLGLSALLALIFAAGGMLWATPSSEVPLALLIGALALPALTFARIRQAAVVGLGHVRAGQLPETLVQPLALLLLVSLIPVTGATWIPVIAYVSATAIASAAGVWILRRTLPAAGAIAESSVDARALTRTALPFVWIAAMNTLLTYGDVLIVGMVSDAASAGVYRVASHAAMLVAFPLTAVNMAAAPRIAAAFARQDSASMQQVATTAARRALLGAIAILLALCLFGRPVLGLFGAEFVAGYPAMVILGAAYLFNAAAGTSGYLLIMTNHEPAAGACFTIAGLLTVIGNLLLVPRWGIEGAAIASGVSVIVLSAGLVLTARRRLGIRPTALGRLRAA